MAHTLKQLIKEAERVETALDWVSREHIQKIISGYATRGDALTLPNPNLYDKLDTIRDFAEWSITEFTQRPSATDKSIPVTLPEVVVNAQTRCIAFSNQYPAWRSYLDQYEKDISKSSDFSAEDFLNLDLGPKLHEPNMRELIIALLTMVKKGNIKFKGTWISPLELSNALSLLKNSSWFNPSQWLLQKRKITTPIHKNKTEFPEALKSNLIEFEACWSLGFESAAKALLRLTLEQLFEHKFGPRPLRKGQNRPISWNEYFKEKCPGNSGEVCHSLYDYLSKTVHGKNNSSTVKIIKLQKRDKEYVDFEIKSLLDSYDVFKKILNHVTGNS